MRKVFKYELKIISDTTTSLRLPENAELLCVHHQLQDNLCLWALVDPDANPIWRYFRVTGTGYPLSQENLKYVGTAHLTEGSLVLHVFEVLYA